MFGDSRRPHSDWLSETQRFRALQPQLHASNVEPQVFDNLIASLGNKSRNDRFEAFAKDLLTDHLPLYCSKIHRPDMACQ